MKQIEKLRVVKKHLETLRNTIKNMNNISPEELKNYIKIVLQSKTQLYPELLRLLNESLVNLNEVLNEDEDYRKKLSDDDFKKKI